MAFAIGIEYPKHKVNVGTLIRSAELFGAAMVFTVGRPYRFQSSDTTKSYRRLPILHFASWEDYRASAVFAWVPVAVEIVDGKAHPRDTPNRDGTVDRWLHPLFATETEAREWVYAL